MKTMEKLNSFECDKSALDMITGGANSDALGRTKYTTQSKDLQGNVTDECKYKDKK